MALQNTDLFYVQRGDDGHKIEYSDLKSDIAAGAGVSKIVAGNNITINPTDGTGVVTINGEAGGGGGGGGDFVEQNQQVALIVDQKASGTDGGSSAATTWQVRTLNTEIYDDDGIVALSGTNGFTLEPGEYEIEWSAPAFRVDRHQTALSTSTNSADIIALGSNAYTQINNSNAATHSTGSFKVNIDAATTYHILHYTMQENTADNALGLRTDSGEPEIYTQVKITNLAGVTVNANGGIQNITYNGAAAWGKVGAAGTLLNGSNVKSVSRGASGEYAIEFTNPMPSVDYAITLGHGEEKYIAGYNSQTVNGFNVYIRDGENLNNFANTQFSFAVHALNALPPMGGTGTDAWGDVNTNGTLDGGFNCTSSKTGTGLYQVTFTSPMPNTDYSITQSTNDTQFKASYSNKTVNGFVINILDVVNTGLADSASSFAVHATNATLPLTITEDQIAALIQNPVLSAWGDISAGTTLRNGFNIDSITIANTNEYTINFINPMPNTNYSVVATPKSDTSQRFATVGTKTTTSCQVLIWDQNGNVATSGFAIQVASEARNGTLGGGADAWCCHNGDGDIEGSFNITGCTRNSPGNYTYTLANSMPGGARSYAVVVSANFKEARVLQRNATSFQVETCDSDGIAHDADTSVAVFATDGNAGGFWVRTGDELAPISDDIDVKIGGGDIELNANGSASFANSVISDKAFNVKKDVLQFTDTVFSCYKPGASTSFYVKGDGSASFGTWGAPGGVEIRDGQLKSGTGNAANRVNLHLQKTDAGAASKDFIQCLDLNDNVLAKVGGDGSATFAGNITAPNVTFNLDDGSTLAVKDRVLNLVSRLDALEANEMIDDAVDTSLLSLLASASARLDSIEARLTVLEGGY